MVIKGLKIIGLWLSDWLNALIIFITSLTLGAYLLYFNSGISTNQNYWGLFGDYLGGVLGTLISLIAVLLIYRTYKLQQDLFHLQRKELTSTTEAFKQQNKYLQEQQFENIVFRLLDRRDKLLSQINYNQCVGIEAIIKFLERHYSFKNENKVDSSQDHFDYNITKFLPYFLSFVSTVNYMESFKVNSSKSNNDLKKQLFDVYRVTLTEREKKLLDIVFEHYTRLPDKVEPVHKARQIVYDRKIFELNVINQGYINL